MKNKLLNFTQFLTLNLYYLPNIQLRLNIKALGFILCDKKNRKTMKTKILDCKF